MVKHLFARVLLIGLEHALEKGGLNSFPLFNIPETVKHPFARVLLLGVEHALEKGGASCLSVIQHTKQAII